MTQPTTSASTISQKLLGELAHVSPSGFSKRRDRLPPATLVPTGASGHPPLTYNIDDVAALVAAQTAHLSDLACRLRVALGATSPLRIVQVDDRHHVVRDDEHLSDLQPDVRDALLQQIRADRDANTNRRARPVTTEESQP